MSTLRPGNKKRLDKTGSVLYNRWHTVKKNSNRAIRDQLDAIKSAPCMDCGKAFHPCQMDFDHRPGTVKVTNIGRMVNDEYSLGDILDEISKCDLVCANCHRLRTWLRRMGRK
jgi:hypothetical protein